jgi:hypothetical protein
MCTLEVGAERRRFCASQNGALRWHASLPHHSVNSSDRP